MSYQTGNSLTANTQSMQLPKWQNAINSSVGYQSEQGHIGMIKSSQNIIYVQDEDMTRTRNSSGPRTLRWRHQCQSLLTCSTLGPHCPEAFGQCLNCLVIHNYIGPTTRDSTWQRISVNAAGLADNGWAATPAAAGEAYTVATPCKAIPSAMQGGRRCTCSTRSRAAATHSAGEAPGHEAVKSVHWPQGIELTIPIRRAGELCMPGGGSELQRSRLDESLRAHPMQVGINTHDT
ncbi:hypothetical protein B0H14DRAFT_2612615 [Mycena olivaceomarginata]|nr:hypothetical protein B0H14DRAFT_2612615 [Mycena olivaceomarginata]